MSSRNIKLYIKNPLTIYLIVWGGGGLLFETKFSYILDGIHEDFFYFLATMFGMFFLGWLSVFAIAPFLKKNSSFIWMHDYTEKLNRLNTKVLKIWVAIELFQIIFSEGLPLAWLIIGNGKTYVDFGVGSINGLANALYLTLQLNYAFLYSIDKRKKFLRYYLYLLIWPLIAVTRQVLISSILEFLIVFFSFHELKKKLIIKVVSWSIVVVILFGAVGDMRTGKDVFIDLAEPRYEMLEKLPSGVLWVGIYLTTPIANLQNTFEYISPDDTYWHTFGKLIPSVIRGGFGDKYAMPSELTMDTGLIVSNFNVSSYAHKPLLDQGVWFVYVMTYVISLVGNIIYFMAKRKKNYLFITSNSVFCMMTMLSVFDNLFLFLPVTFQFVFLYAFNNLLRIKNENGYKE